MLLGLNLLNSDDKTQREKMLKATSPLLAVIAGAGTVEHRNGKTAGKFTKQRNKGVAERDHYLDVAAGIVGGTAAFKECRSAAASSPRMFRVIEDGASLGGTGLTSGLTAVVVAPAELENLQTNEGGPPPPPLTSPTRGPGPGPGGN